MIRIVTDKRTVEVKETTADVVYEEHTTRTIFFCGIPIHTKKYDYKCTPFDDGCKRGLGFKKTDK